MNEKNISVKANNTINTIIFKDKWIPFIDTILEPLFVIPLIFGITICVLQFTIFSKSQEIQVVLSFLFAISSGFIGSTIRIKINKYIEEDALHARGKTSIRSLALLKIQLDSLLARLHSFIHDIPSSINQDDKNIIINNFEEISSQCCILIDQTMSSIENWNDIINDADIMNQIYEKDKRIQIERIKAEKIYAMIMETTNQRHQEEKDKLKTELKEREDEINKLSNEIVELQRGAISLPTSTGFMSSGSLSQLREMGSWSITDPYYRCSRCSYEFQAPREARLSPSTFGATVKGFEELMPECPKCKSAGFVSKM